MAGVIQHTFGDGTASGIVATNVVTTTGGNTQALAACSGVGAHAAIPTNGTNAAPVAIGTPPEGAIGVRMYCPPGASFGFVVAASAGAATTAFAAGAFKTFAQGSDGPNWDENLMPGMNVYVGAISGASGSPGPNTPVPSYRYL